MAKAWLSYAWEDNKAQDVDFAAQELVNDGLDIHLDRWVLGAGKRLWDQIERFIQDPDKSDAWILYATQNSLQSEPCREEFAYALDRALTVRGRDFPIIGLFSGPVDKDLIPAAIRTRLYVSVTDPDWKERIVAAAERRTPTIAKPIVDPYQLTMHAPCKESDSKYAIEVRPRAGTWTPFFAAVPLAEKDLVELTLVFGPRGTVPSGCALFMSGNGITNDGMWWASFAQNECTPTQSYFLLCKVLPSKLIFGVNEGFPQYRVIGIPQH